MTKRMTFLALALAMVVMSSVASAANPHFGRMAFFHHVSPSHHAGH